MSHDYGLDMYGNPYTLEQKLTFDRIEKHQDLLHEAYSIMCSKFSDEDLRKFISDNQYRKKIS